jgi:purine-nucleoside phosphorylase
MWTTDGGYRETRGKFVNHRNAGVLGVDMETSAVLAVAQYRGVEAASAVVISDLLSETEWKPGFHNPAIQRNTSVLVKAILDTL